MGARKWVLPKSSLSLKPNVMFENWNNTWLISAAVLMNFISQVAGNRRARRGRASFCSRTLWSLHGGGCRRSGRHAAFSAKNSDGVSIAHRTGSTKGAPAALRNGTFEETRGVNS